MATVQNRTSYWEQAKEQGFDLSWLSQLEESVTSREVDELSANYTGRVEGSIPRNDVARFGAYTFNTKSEVWAHNLTKLYQEFITRQWSSATDIPWETIQDCPMTWKPRSASCPRSSPRWSSSPPMCRAGSLPQCRPTTTKSVWP